MYNLRKSKEEELTKTLTNMLEDSRTTLKSEIGYELNSDTYANICDIIDEDIDNKLLLIPSTIKLMLDDAEEKAEVQ